MDVGEITAKWQKGIKMLAYMNAVSYLCNNKAREHIDKSVGLLHVHKQMKNLSQHGI